MTNTRVLLYTSADTWRGAAISFTHIARGLARHGAEPLIIATNAAMAHDLGAVTSAMHLPAGRRAAFMLRRALLATKPDVLLVDRARDLRIATRAVLGTGIPLVFRYNLFRVRPPTDLLTRIAYRTTVREVVFLSDLARHRVLAEAPFMRRARATTIAEGIDTEAFCPNATAAHRFRNSYGVADAPFLLAVGAVTPEKRYDTLLESLALLGDEAPLLMLCGEGEGSASLRAAADALRVRVQLTGRIPREHLIGAYNACTAFVHTGASETFGLAVAEAMACGAAVVVSDGGALPEIVGPDQRCGLLVPRHMPAQFAAAIRALVTGPESMRRTLGSHARRRIAARFSLDRMEAAYALLVDRHSRRRPRQLWSARVVYER